LPLPVLAEEALAPPFSVNEERAILGALEELRVLREKVKGLEAVIASDSKTIEAMQKEREVLRNLVDILDKTIAIMSQVNANQQKMIADLQGMLKIAYAERDKAKDDAEKYQSYLKYSVIGNIILAIMAVVAMMAL
jgi:chromosome segregation ATPase